MTQSAPIHAIFVALMAVFVPISLAAQDADAIPMPAQISELATTETAPWAAPMGSLASRQRLGSLRWERVRQYEPDLGPGGVSPVVAARKFAASPGYHQPCRASAPAAGALGVPGTQVLFGGERVDDEARSGFRTSLGVRLGHWFDLFMDSELQFDYLWLGDGQTSGDYQADSFQYAILARPYSQHGAGPTDLAVDLVSEHGDRRHFD